MIPICQNYETKKTTRCYIKNEFVWIQADPIVVTLLKGKLEVCRMISSLMIS
jgi:hypothetical protein